MITKDDQHYNELCLIAYMIANGNRPERAEDILSVCSPESFKHQDTRAIASGVAECLNDGNICDIVNVCNNLKTKGALNIAGGASGVADIVVRHGDHIIGFSSAMGFARSLNDVHRLAVASTALSELQGKIGANLIPVDDVAEYMHSLASGISGAEKFVGMTFDQQIEEYVRELQDGSRSAIPTKTPWREVNAIIRGGILPGELAVLAARPSVGKSALALNMAWSVACSGRNSIFNSIEMGRRQLMDRLVANVGNLDVGTFREGMGDRGISFAVKAAQSMLGSSIKIYDETSVTVSDIRKKIRHEQRTGKDVGLVVVDYLQLMTPGKRSNSREREVAEMSRALKCIAGDLNVPLLVLAQLNRKVEEGKREPMLSDLRESGAIEQDADIVIFLHQSRTAWHPDEPVKIIIAKGRSSGVGSAYLTFKRKFQRFEDSQQGAFDEAQKSESVKHWTENNDMD